MIRDDVELERAYAGAGFPRDIHAFLDTQELAPSVTNHAASLLLQIYCDHTYGEILTTSDAPRYDFIERMSETEHSCVYKVRDNETNCLCVLKIANPQRREEAKRLLDNERAKYESVTSPHVVKCYSYNYTRKDGKDYLFYLVLNLVEGTDLSRALKNQVGIRWEYHRAASVARDIASGLADLHSRCIVHRDIKPANIVVSTNGAATIVDLGIAATVTNQPDPAGTEGYLSPEQAHGNDALLPSDIFSFGLVLWEMLVGGPYFTTRGPAYLREIQLHHEPKSLQSYRADAPEALHTIVTDCLHRVPKSRPNATEIVKRLDSYLTSYGPALDALCTHTDRSEYIAAKCVDVFDELTALVDDWLCSSEPASRVLAITGHPGDGKTCFVSWWTRKHAPGSAVFVWLCNDGRFDNPRESTCNPTTFVAQLIRELSHHLPGYPGSVTFDRHYLEQKPLDALARYVTTPLATLQRPVSSRPLVIAIDGIDAAENKSFADGTSMEDVLQLLAEQLPSYFRLLITCRPGCGALSRLPEAPVTISLDGEHRTLVRQASIALCIHYLATNGRFRDRVIAYARTQSIGAPLEGEWLESLMLSNLTFAVQCRDQNLRCTRDWCEDVAAGRVTELLTASYAGGTASRAFRSFLERPAVRKPDAYGLLFATMCAAARPIPEELLIEAVPDWPHGYRDASGLITVTPTGDVAWRHPTFRELAQACHSEIRINLLDGHAALAKACHCVLGNRLAFSTNCGLYALENYGYHLLGSREHDTYRRWLLGEDRIKAFIGHDGLADSAVTNEYSILQEMDRTGFILADKEVFDAFIESGVRSLARTCRLCYGMFRGDVTPDLIEIISSVVENIAEPKYKLLVFGPETECVVGVAPWDQTDYNTFIMDPMWAHPLHVQLQIAVQRQAKKVLLVYADLYLRLLGSHVPPSISDDTKQVIRRNGYGPRFIKWVREELLHQQQHNRAPNLGWVNTHVALMHREFDHDPSDALATACNEVETNEQDMCNDSSFIALLHMLFLMGMGWTPDSRLKSEWAQCSWSELGATPAERGTTLANALKASGGLDAVDRFVQDFLVRVQA